MLMTETLRIKPNKKQIRPKPNIIVWHMLHVQNMKQVGILLIIYGPENEEHCGSVVECLMQDQMIAG